MAPKGSWKLNPYKYVYIQLYQDPLIIIYTRRYFKMENSGISFKELLGYIENPKITSKFMEGSRAYNIPDDSYSLNGTWNFALYDGLVSGLESVFDSKKAPASWNDIKVPGHWQLQGYGDPQYTNIKYPFPVNPPYVPSQNPTGVYNTSFWISDDEMNNFKTLLRFDGVDSAYYVFLNGVFCGFSKGSRNPAEFNIHSQLKINSVNSLTVVVVKWCDGSYIEDQDQWWLSGIFRDVTLVKFHRQAYVWDYYIKTDNINATNGEAEVTVSVFIYSVDNVEKEFTAGIYHTGVEKEIVVGSPTSKVINRKGYCGGYFFELLLKFKIENAHLWTAEDPYLYKLVVKSTTGLGLLNVNFGVRTTKIEDGLLKINGRPIILKGVNHHDHHPQKGRAISENDIIKDLKTMKQFNINAIRCSHYPSHPSLLHWADKLGFYVIDEADIECHGFLYYDSNGQPSIDDEPPPYGGHPRPTNPVYFKSPGNFTTNNRDWKDAYLDRVTRMANRDKNHPSIIMFSLGNESFFGSNIKESFSELTKLFSIPIHYEGDKESDHYPEVVDVRSRMYLSHEDVEKEGKKPSQEHPFILCEFGHAMGNGPGGVKDYFDLFYKYRQLQGGFIWEWANHGLKKQVPGSKGDNYFYAYGGDFGEPVHDGTFVMDGLCDSEHNPTPGLLDYKYVIQPAKFSFQSLETGKVELTIENMLDFEILNDDRYELMVSLAEFTRSPISASLQSEYKSRKILPFDVPIEPHGLGKYIVDFPATTKDGVDGIVTASLRLKNSTDWADAGHEVASGQYILTRKALKTHRLNDIIGQSNGYRQTELQLENSYSSCRITSSSSVVEFSRVTGKITNLKLGRNRLVADGPKLGFWRAPTDNDIGEGSNTNSGGIVKQWKDHYVDQLQESLESLHAEKMDSNGGFQVTVVSWIAPPVVSWLLSCRTMYSITRDHMGLLNISIDINLIPKGSYPSTLPRIGLDFILDDDLDYVRWYGRDVESYPDMNSAGKIGVHSCNNLRDLYTPYEVPQENGNRTDVRWVEFMHGEGLDASEKLTIAVPQDSDETGNFSVQPWGPEKLEAAGHQYELERDHRKRTHFSFNFAVNGIGSESCGPSLPLKDQLVLKKEQDFSVQLSLTT